MIAEQQDTTGLVLNAPIRSQRLGIKNFGKISRILQDTLYSDKELAVLREYSTNASDAHVEAGCPNRPIIVRLPNRFNPVLAIRDFGPGMDDHRVWDIFCNYGESTKDKANDEVGMFGIGSKSAFCYGKSFTIVSFQNGFRKSYVCHTGGCNEGEFVEMGSVPTTEENGLEIQIPVQATDVDVFVSKAAKFFAHWRVMPLFEGNSIEIPKVEKEFFGENWYLPKSVGDTYSRASSKPKFLMGNIPYDLPELAKLKGEKFGVSDDDSYNLRRLLELGLVISSPIGSVDIAANRETLQFTDKTLTTIWEILTKVRSELAVIMDEAFDVLPTTYQKKQLRANYNEYSHAYNSLSFLLSPKYAGLSTDYTLGKREDRGFDCLVYGKSRRGARRVRLVGNNYDHSMPCKDNQLYVETDDTLFNPTQIRNRVVNLIEHATNPFGRTFSSVRVISVFDRVKFVEWCDKNGFDVPMAKVSTLPEYKMSDIYPSMKKPSTRSINADKNSRRFLALDMSKGKDGYSSDYFSIVSIPKKSVVPYIIIDRYEVTGFGDNITPFAAIECINEMCSTFGFSLPSQIVAVKKGAVEKLDSKYFVPLSEYFTKQIVNKSYFVDKMATIKLRVSTCSFSLHTIRHKSDTVNLQIINAMSNLVVSVTGLNSLIRITVVQLATLKSRLSGNKATKNEGSICNFLQPATSSELCCMLDKSLDELLIPFITNIKLVDEKYPMLSVVDDYQMRYLSHNNNLPVVKKVVDYINLVDSSIDKK